jgi:hypothetical protein
MGGQVDGCTHAYKLALIFSYKIAILLHAVNAYRGMEV